MAFSDNELLAKFLAGDEGSFCELVERYQSPLVNYIYRFTGNREIAEEVVQETFMSIFQNASQFKQDGIFRSWIYAIATNRAKNSLRKRQPVCNQGMEERFSSTDDPVEIASKKEKEIAVRKALHDLSEEQRSVFILRFYQGLAYEEIAIALGCPLGTVKSRMCYALEKMRGILHQYKE